MFPLVLFLFLLNALGLQKILSSLITKIERKLIESYGLTIQFDFAKIVSIKMVIFDCRITTTKYRIDIVKLKIHFNLLHLIFKNKQNGIKSILVDSLSVQLLYKEKGFEEDSSSLGDYNLLGMERILKKFLSFSKKFDSYLWSLTPQTLNVKRIAISKNEDETSLDFQLAFLFSSKGFSINICSTSSIKENNTIYGRIQKHEKGQKIFLYGDNIYTKIIPILFGLDILAIMKFRVIINHEHILKDNTQCFGLNLYVGNLFIKRGLKDTYINKVHIITPLEIRDLSLNTKSKSTVKLNKLVFTVNLHFDLAFDDNINLRVLLDNCTLRDFLTSFPNFNTKEIYNIEALGYFSIKAQLDLPLRAYHRFDFRLKFLNKVIEWNLGNFNNSFFKKTIKLSNKVVLNSYVLASDIPDIIKDTIVFVEDRNFYKHKGVDTFFMGYALYTNLSHRGLKRGGSTITMQLARNLFLNHDKSFLRKIEETFISLMIENILMIDKGDLLELYLNVIEFAGDVRGIKDAAQYYFNKSLCEISYLEALVLSYIIPRPLFFVDAVLQNSHQLQLNLIKHIRNTSAEMLKLGLIDSDTVNEMPKKVVFSHNLHNCYISLE